MMNKIIRNVAVGLLLSACMSSPSIAHAENPTILTPAQKAVNDEIFRLGAEADAALDAGKYTLAEADARKAMSLGWLGGTCRVALAAALNAQGKDKEALQAYKAVADGSDEPCILLPCALLLFKSGQYAQAADAYNKALPCLPFGGLVRSKSAFSLDTSQPIELETLIHTALGLTWTGESLWGADPNYSRALDEYQKALQLSPDNALAHLYKGDVLERLGFKAQAQAAYAQAAKLGDGDVRKAAEDDLAGR